MAGPLLSATQWLSPGVGLSAGVLAGVELAYLVAPWPMAQATIGLTF